LVDPESIEARLSRLAELLDQLERIRTDGESAYRGDFRIRLAAQHALQLAIQTCIDISAHLVSERDLEMPTDYRGVFDALRALGLEADLADRLGRAAGLRNILVHDYLDLDDALIWSALSEIDDLRAFAAFAAAILP
jgi:uncharacterized protein YutE (UPF0331/DUF86 family)